MHYEKENGGWIKHLDFIIWDVLATAAAYVFAYRLHLGTSWVNRRMLYNNGTAIVILAGLLASFFLDTHKNVLRRNILQELSSVVKYTAFVVTVLLVLLFFRQEGVLYSRLSLVYFALFEMVFLFFERLFWKKFLLARLRKEQRQRHMLVVTAKDISGAAALFLKKNAFPDIELVGMVLVDDDSLVGGRVEGIPVPYAMKDCINRLQGSWIDEVMVYLPKEMAIPEKFLGQLAEMGVTSHLRLHVENERKTVQTVEKVAGCTVLTESIRQVSSGQNLMKRMMDILGGFIGLFLTVLLTFIVGPLIFFADPGPVFFKQKRVGRNGRIFYIYKFRSMYQDAELRKQELMDKNEMKGFMFKMDEDPRIIGSGPDGKRHGIGWFIRKTSIDEFPQFWNVLKGDMSLVGTRPPTLDEWREYDPHHRARMAIKPGLTGLWQVSGRSDITDFEEVIRLDLKYINTWTVAEDILIICKTVKLLLTGSGAK
ncbi:MAG: sugar transferase [Lachnospiraceae bacterium]|nr:sugar transferase [Lachnospiraceae bacterium]